jgi:tripartite-type tricarboxylate transporter receptor subunit TctC
MTPLLPALLLGASLALGLTPAHAQSANPVKIVIGFPPGGALDTLARALADELRVSLKETVIVENRPGASSRISIETVKTSKPDGHTILLASTPPFVLFPLTYSRLNYDLKDFTPVAHLAYVPSVLSVGMQQPYKTVGEYIAWVKKNPGQGTIGLTNLGGALHFSILRMAKAIDTPLTPVTYKGGAPLATDLVGGHVPASADALASQLELHRAGKLRILGVTGTRRVSWLPEVPTIKESGLDAFERATVAYGAFVPSATPRDLVAKLESAFIAAIRSAPVRERLDRVGLDASGLTGAELAKSMKEEREYWAPVVKASGFKNEE